MGSQCYPRGDEVIEFKFLPPEDLIDLALKKMKFYVQNRSFRPRIVNFSNLQAEKKARRLDEKNIRSNLPGSLILLQFCIMGQEV